MVMINRPTSKPFLLALTGTFIFLFFVLSKNGSQEHRADLEKPSGLKLSQYQIKTHKGFVSMEELNDKVYKKFGYEIVRPTYPVPTLAMLNEPTCDVVFSEWLKVSKEPQPDVPPKEIPENRKDEFLLNGYSALNSWYFEFENSAKSISAPRNWNEISYMVNYTKERLGGFTYGSDGVSVYHAMQFHKLDGGNVLVVGSLNPWVEAIALIHGAKHVLTVEYSKIIIPEEFSDRMTAILTADFVKEWEKYAGTFDFVASFSSIEHSGLGRYGDPIDPIGDIREMLKIKCMLRKGGLLFLGFPLGTDAISYNAHRIYGPIRLAFMFYGFEWIGSFTGTSEKPFDITSAWLHHAELFQHSQLTLVLRKL